MFSSSVGRLSFGCFLGLTCLLSQTARADTFRVFFYNLDGKSITSSPGVPSRLQVFRQSPGSTVQAGSLFANVRIAKDSEVLKDLHDGGTGGLQFDLDLPESSENRALVFVARRFDEPSPTAVVGFVLEPRNDLGRPHELHLVVPTSAAPAMALPDSKPSCVRRIPRCRCRGWFCR